MISVTELRIGNWVKHFGSPVQVIRLTKNKIPLEQPIFLTPEILEKCGFGSYSNPNNTPSTIYFLGSFRLIKSNYADEIFLADDFYRVKVESLHQLQNLYYASMQNEIIFKP